MSMINYGSFCIDHVYQVKHFVRPGETLAGYNYQIYPGGKGLNQSLALAKAGAEVKHAGKIGPDGLWLKELLDTAGVDTSLTQQTDTMNGHAIIQITPEGENAIVLYSGANQAVQPEDFPKVFATSKPGDLLLIQNEISSMRELIDYAVKKQQRIAFNVAPFTPTVLDYSLDKVEYLILNETEAAGVTQTTLGSSPNNMLESLNQQLPDAKIVLTLGKQGAIYRDQTQEYQQPAFAVKALDTTGAGDTFTGFFLAGVLAQRPINECLQLAAKAAAICVTRPGAATSIPTLQEVETLGR